jgi:hypothetical protein
VGGIVFGVGMVLAGGCGAGTLWRAGEGHVKLILALVGFSIIGSTSWRFLEAQGWLERLGNGVFLPDLVGWKLAWVILLAFLTVWYLGVVWNELKGKLVIE